MRATKTNTYPKIPICRSFKPSRFIASGSTRTSAPPRLRSSEGVVKNRNGPFEDFDKASGPNSIAAPRTMTNNARTWLLRRKWILAAVALPVFIALWWAFRPEKLWINQKVNEAAPFDASGEPQPILTARFNAKAQQTGGRATVYKKPGGGKFL